MFKSKLLKTANALTPEQLEFVRELQEEIKASEGRLCLCGEVSEVLNIEFGWERWAGDYDMNGKATAHYWNSLPDGSIVDATHGQFGSPDLGIFRPGSSEAKLYHPYCADQGCRHCEAGDYSVPCRNR